MKRVLIFLLLPVFMLNGSLGELFKVPVILSHFTEHHKANENLGLVEFLSMHYWGDDRNDRDQERDMQLPFKKMNVSFSLELIAIPVAKLNVEKKQLFHTPKTMVPGPGDSHLSSPHLDGLFRPPIV
ncbi:MAG: hypothetical protein ACO1O6_14755 [Bacteroidota bacterium]